ncbi:MAG: hypothetical protein HUN04_07155 [Desulfobacter sp.]|nr:MAG: hypothetical protein HUN04_07155 [Desulfobacter sp.]
MSSITSINPYSSGSLYQSAGETLATQKSSGTQGNKNETAEASNDQDVTVSLSKAVAQARLRESMGLAPTGRLSLDDFKAAAEDREKTVADALARTMNSLGIDSGQKISLSLDSDNKLTISESFSGKSKLQNTLNEDEEFMAAFKQLSANQEVVSFTEKLSSGGTSMVDYMDDTQGWDGAMALANQYNQIKASGNSLSALLGASRSETPYTYVHLPEETGA